MTHSDFNDRDAEDQFIADNGEVWSANVATARDGLNYYVRPRHAVAAAKAMPARKSPTLSADDRAAVAVLVRELRAGIAQDLTAIRMPVLVAVAAKLTGTKDAFASKSAAIAAIQKVGV
jgi:hypothetical protein